MMTPEQMQARQWRLVSYVALACLGWAMVATGLDVLAGWFTRP